MQCRPDHLLHPPPTHTHTHKQRSTEQQQHKGTQGGSTAAPQLSHCYPAVSPWHARTDVRPDAHVRDGSEARYQELVACPRQPPGQAKVRHLRHVAPRPRPRLWSSSRCGRSHGRVTASRRGARGGRRRSGPGDGRGVVYGAGAGMGGSGVGSGGVASGGGRGCSGGGGDGSACWRGVQGLQRLRKGRRENGAATRRQ